MEFRFFKIFEADNLKTDTQTTYSGYGANMSNKIVTSKVLPYRDHVNNKIYIITFVNMSKNIIWNSEISDFLLQLHFIITLTIH